LAAIQIQSLNDMLYMEIFKLSGERTHERVVSPTLYFPLFVIFLVQFLLLVDDQWLIAYYCLHIETKKRRNGR